MGDRLHVCDIQQERNQSLQQHQQQRQLGELIFILAAAVARLLCCSVGRYHGTTTAPRYFSHGTPESSRTSFMSIMLTLAVLPPKLLPDSDEGHTYLLTSEERANVAVETGTGTFSKTRESRHETRHMRHCYMFGTGTLPTHRYQD